MSADRPTIAALEALGPARAAAFFLERLEHDADDGDDALFRQWLDASDANALAWDRALDLWDAFDEADDEALDAMRREALVFRPRRLSSIRLRYAAAASIALVASTVLFLHLDRTAPRPPAPAVATRPDLHSFGPPDYTTAVGQRATMTLDDGSRLTLDTDSAVDVAYSDGLRMVRLARGQAYFDVTHDPARPFRVAAGGRIISVLGTRFNIRLSPAETRVVLVQGSIGVSRGDDPAHPDPQIERLTPGQQLVVHAGRPDAIGSIDVEPGLAWKRGFVQFDGETLAAAVEELNRYTDRPLVIEDPQVAALRVSGAFPTGDMDRFVETLTALYPVRVATLDGGRRAIVRQR